MIKTEDRIPLLVLFIVLVIGLVFANFVYNQVKENRELAWYRYDRLLTLPSENITGKVISTNKINLIYVDNQGFGSSNIIKLPISVIRIEVIKNIIVQPHALRKVKRTYTILVIGDMIETKEVIKTNIRKCKSLDAGQIYYLYYGEPPHDLLTVPSKSFNIDGFII